MKIAFKPWMILSAAIAMGSIAAFLANRYIKDEIDTAQAAINHSQSKKMQVVVIKSDQLRGTALTRDDLAIREIDADLVNADMITPDNYEGVVGKRLLLAVRNGQPLQRTFIESTKSLTFSGKVQLGMRALTIQVDDINSISGMIVPGDNIDLIASIKQNEKSATQLLLQKVRVLATGQSIIAKDDAEVGMERRPFNTMTLELSPKDAEKIVAAQEDGKLTAVLRHPEDEKVAIASAVSKLGIVVDNKHKTPVLASSDVPNTVAEQQAVQIIYGGMENRRPATKRNNNVATTKLRNKTNPKVPKLDQAAIEKITEQIISADERHEVVSEVDNDATPVAARD